MEIRITISPEGLSLFVNRLILLSPVGKRVPGENNFLTHFNMFLIIAYFALLCDRAIKFFLHDSDTVNARCLVLKRLRRLHPKKERPTAHYGGTPLVLSV